MSKPGTVSTLTRFHDWDVFVAKHMEFIPMATSVLCAVYETPR